jgi:hypothetical protein
MREQSPKSAHPAHASVMAKVDEMLHGCDSQVAAATSLPHPWASPHAGADQQAAVMTSLLRREFQLR